MTYRFPFIQVAALAMTTTIACASPDANATPGRGPKPTSAPSDRRPTPDDTIVVNGRVIDDAKLAQLGVTRAQVRPGNYWYDTRSGLAGHVGQHPTAIIRAGLPLGPLDPDCSGGATGYFLNGRHITWMEAQWIGNLTGYIPPGRYFVEANGDAGQEGGPVAINLVQASRRQGGGGGSTVSRGMFNTTEVDSTGVAVRSNTGGGTLLWPF